MNASSGSGEWPSVRVCVSTARKYEPHPRHVQRLKMTKCTAGGAPSRRGAGPRSPCVPECDHPPSQQCPPSPALRNWPSVSPLSGSEQGRILSAKGILNALFGVGVRQPLTIHNEQILVAARIHVQIAHPTAIASLDQRRFLRLPFVEGA